MISASLFFVISVLYVFFSNIWPIAAVGFHEGPIARF